MSKKEFFESSEKQQIKLSNLPLTKKIRTQPLPEEYKNWYFQIKQQFNHSKKENKALLKTMETKNKEITALKNQYEQVKKLI